MVEPEQHPAIGEHVGAEAGEAAGARDIHARLEREGAQEVGGRQGLRSPRHHGVDEGIGARAPYLGDCGDAIGRRDGAHPPRQLDGLRRPRGPGTVLEREGELETRHLEAEDRTEVIASGRGHGLRGGDARDLEAQVRDSEARRVVVVDGQLDRHVPSPLPSSHLTGMHAALSLGVAKGSCASEAGASPTA